MLARLTSWCFRRRWQTLILWIALLITSNIAAGQLGLRFENSFSLPGTESQESLDLLIARFPSQSGDEADLVVRAPDGIEDPTTRARLEAAFAELEAIDGVGAVASPFDVDPQAPPQISQDGTIAFAKVQFEEKIGDVHRATLLDAIAVADRLSTDGLTAALGGQSVQETEQPEGGLTEVIGLLAAVVILLITFGSVLAMGLPLVVALFGIGVGMAVLTLLSHGVSTPEFTPIMASMIGIAVGIDYALFIVTRQRQGIHEGRTPEDANRVAMGTAGRAVLFAGATVVIALLGILLAGFEFVEGVAVGSSAVVLMTMLASVTLLPALLGFVGENIDRWGIKRLTSKEAGAEGSMWWRWSRNIQQRPWLWASLSLGLLLLLASPLLTMRMGVSDAGNNPEGSGSRTAYDLLAEGFGPGFNAPFLLVAELEGPDDLAALNEIAASLRDVDGVAGVSPAIPNEAGDTAIVNLLPTSAPQDAETDELVRRLRDDVLPQLTADGGPTVLVGGITPIFSDFADKVADRLAYVIGAVILVSFILLMIVFRSIMVPLKAAVMNLLSIGAAYGVIVAIFQWGWGNELLGIGREGPIDAWAPLMLFAILFGLSMDYEVFLLSRIREDYTLTGDNALAVANGVATTARVITAAAMIMVTVFIVFAIGGGVRAVTLFAIGLATAILVDATVVRLVLVPSTMELLGDANWWIPRWLDRILPNLSIEGEPHEAASQAPDQQLDPAPTGS